MLIDLQSQMFVFRFDLTPIVYIGGLSAFMVDVIPRLGPTDSTPTISALQEPIQVCFKNISHGIHLWHHRASQMTRIVPFKDLPRSQIQVHDTLFTLF